MQFEQNRFILFGAIASVGLLFSGACSSNQPTATTNSPVASAPMEPKSSPAASPATNAKTGEIHTHGGQGGQVIESGPYHLELIIGKESTGTHIDFFLQKGDNHTPIPKAKVTAQVQLPDGSQQSLPMTYSEADQHYTAILPSTAGGEYKVAVLSDIKGEKVNGRFRFSR